MDRVIIIGGGASGLMAAYSAASCGKQVILLEKNEKLGKKIYITGKGRCNVTADVSVNDFFQCIVSNPKFLYGAINTFSPSDLMEFFEGKGLKLKVERGNRVFPASDKASDVTKTLEKGIISLGVDIRLNTSVVDIIFNDGQVNGVITDNGEELLASSVIVCCGGKSYTSTGSTGDGYEFAKKAGHHVVELKPSLVGVELKGSDFISMQGLALKNVKLSVYNGNKKLHEEFGEMLFTHFGVSGPIVLSVSSLINRLDLSNMKFSIDLKPALDSQTLANRLLREFKENNVKSIATVLRSLLPKALIDVVLKQANINSFKNCSEITAKDRENLINSLKNLIFLPKKLRPLEEAIVTAGGVSVKEINPKTFESKLVKGLFFAGEVLDVDAFTGGYNLQIAFSTGFIAGKYS